MSTSSGRFRLAIKKGPNPGKTFDLTQIVAIIGRVASADIAVSDVEVSRQHARLSATESGFTIEDLASTNGVFVNGVRITAPTDIKVGDVIAIGELTLTVNDVSAPKGDTFNKPKPGQRFVVVDLTLANTSAKEANVSALLQMELKDASGQKYNPDLMATTAAKGALPDGKLAPGEKLRGQVGFEVPESAADLVFVFDASVFGAGKVFVALPA